MSELAKALASARGEMRGTVYKGGVNQHQRYPYVGHEHVMTSGVREAMQTNGLSLVQTGVEYVGEVPGGKVQALLWRGTFRLLHTSGESLDLSYLATTQANDKSAFVASTSLDRTAFQRVMALAGSSEEDPEHDEHDKRAQQYQQQQAEQQKQQRAAVDAATRAAEAAAGERDRTATTAAYSKLLKDLKSPDVNTQKRLAELREEASKLKPRLSEHQVDELRRALHVALVRVREAEDAEAALAAQAAHQDSDNMATAPDDEQGAP
jgi:hypothetical protein